MDDQEYQDRYNYLHNGKYPDHINSKDLKANFRKACHPFRASQGGILQYEHKKHWVAACSACGRNGEGPTELPYTSNCWTLRRKQDVSSIAIIEIGEFMDYSGNIRGN